MLILLMASILWEMPATFARAEALIDDRECPPGSACVHPLSCTSVPLDWADLLPKPESTTSIIFDQRYPRCRTRTQLEGICCRQTDDEDSGPACCHQLHRLVTTELAASVDHLRLRPTENSVINHGRKEHGHRMGADYDQLYGVNVTTKTHVRTKRCIIGPRCQDEHSRYRRFDGRCNNIGPGHSLWGSAGYPMKRLLAPAYGDHVGSPRNTSITGKALPSARQISALLFDDLSVPDKHYNVLMMQFGQFLVHDITKSKPASDSVECCHRSSSDSNPDCMAITISAHDPFYSQFGVKCMNFIRTAVVPKAQCQAGHSRQISAVTHFIDGSAIYGSSTAEANHLRSHKGGRLKSLKHPQMSNELPPLESATGVCSRNAAMCFKVGDDRANQIVTLVALHTLFLREHNRIAKALEVLNPHWNDEIIFQESRRIVGAEIQHIVYSEYLPKIIGPHFMTKFELHTSKGHNDSYNPKINPSISSEFSSAAFRFGHSTVPGKLEFPQGPVDTHKTFFNPTSLRNPAFYDHLFQGMLRQPMQKSDDKFTNSLTKFLNSKEGKPFGKDLASINIQRGRDHAVRPYNHYLRLKGNKMKTNFTDFGPSAGPKLHKLYSSPNDVDLYVGGILEPPVPGGIVGQTFAEIIGEQFSRLKHGDRYFYSNGHRSNPGHFSKLQLEELQRVTLAGILCANANDPAHLKVQLEAFHLPHPISNPHVLCNSAKVPKLNLILWKT
ncbi:chorion peroxidase-like isoform X2 [Malaya genurostris]|uniref:chorion peroxidase-like isoform X2 n=1 Tax=Malaya genurostris TaxID=325434 RepID=UPI0026F3ED8E|nr:chorion peroxidase-like isoform X2 [Malaya genurostris]